MCEYACAPPRARAARICLQTQVSCSRREAAAVAPQRPEGEFRLVGQTGEEQREEKNNDAIIRTADLCVYIVKYKNIVYQANLRLIYCRVDIQFTILSVVVLNFI